jgi:hypothetical protein
MILVNKYQNFALSKPDFQDHLGVGKNLLVPIETSILGLLAFLDDRYGIKIYTYHRPNYYTAKSSRSLSVCGVVPKSTPARYFGAHRQTAED